MKIPHLLITLIILSIATLNQGCVGKQDTTKSDNETKVDTETNDDQGNNSDIFTSGTYTADPNKTISFYKLTMPDGGKIIIKSKSSLSSRNSVTFYDTALTPITGKENIVEQVLTLTKGEYIVEMRILYNSLNSNSSGSVTIFLSQ